MPGSSNAFASVMSYLFLYDEAIMSGQEATLAALIGSRICHDLISPIGAINNGLELLAMTGQTSAGPEITLIQDSCRNANARIRFFRIAYGLASTEQRTSSAEIRNVLADSTEGGRLTISWNLNSDVPRDKAQLAFLAIQCMEAALPAGGEIQIDLSAGRWKLRAKSARLRYDEALWNGLRTNALDDRRNPSFVQFNLLQICTAAKSRSIDISHQNDTLQLLI